MKGNLKKSDIRAGMMVIMIMEHILMEAGTGGRRMDMGRDMADRLTGMGMPDT